MVIAQQALSSAVAICLSLTNRFSPTNDNNVSITMSVVSSQECLAKIESDLSLTPWPSYQQEFRLQSGYQQESMEGFHMEPNGPAMKPNPA